MRKWFLPLLVSLLCSSVVLVVIDVQEASAETGYSYNGHCTTYYSGVAVPFCFGSNNNLYVTKSTFPGYITTTYLSSGGYVANASAYPFRISAAFEGGNINASGGSANLPLGNWTKQNSTVPSGAVGGGWKYNFSVTLPGSSATATAYPTWITGPDTLPNYHPASVQVSY